MLTQEIIRDSKGASEGCEEGVRSLERDRWFWGETKLLLYSWGCMVSGNLSKENVTVWGTDPSHSHIDFVRHSDFVDFNDLDSVKESLGSSDASSKEDLSLGR